MNPADSSCYLQSEMRSMVTACPAAAATALEREEGAAEKASMSTVVASAAGIVA